MPPQFTYALSVLFILTIGVLFYVIAFNPTPPVKQAVVPQPVSTPPPVQQTATQPPQPTQQELQQQQLQAAREQCDRGAEKYWHEFMEGWPQKFAVAQNDTLEEDRVWQQAINYRATWRQYQVQCIQKTQGTWSVSWGADVEDHALKMNCEHKAKRFAILFATIRAKPTQSDRDAYVKEWYGKYTVRTEREFENWYWTIEKECSRVITGGWTAPSIEELIRQNRTVSR